MRASTAIAVGAAAVVAVAAIASGVHSAIGGGSGGSSQTTAAAPAPAPAAPATTALPIGDVRRLPAVTPGELAGLLVVYTDDLCLPLLVDLGSLLETSIGGMGPACSLWVSPGRKAFAAIPPPPEDGEIVTAAAVTGRPRDTGVPYAPGNRGALTVADDGAVATCDGSSVLLGRGGRVRTVRTFTSASSGFDERCVTGAIGNDVVRLGDDRRSLVDVASGHVVRRLATAVRRSVVAIATSTDGLVLIADAEDGAPKATVYGRDGKITITRRPIGRDIAVRKAVLARGAVAVAIQSARGWDITSLTNGHAIASGGATPVTDVAFSPDATAVAETTADGVVFADLPGLTPRLFLDLPARAVAWFPPHRLRRGVLTDGIGRVGRRTIAR